MATALPALAGVPALESRLGRALAGADYDRAAAALEDASALVRLEGRSDWVDTTGAPSAPPAVVAVVLAAAGRVVRNPEGFSSETEGDYTYRLPDTGIGVYLTEAEQAIVARFRPAPNRLWTQPTTRCDHEGATVFLEDSYGAELFPVDTAPWS